MEKRLFNKIIKQQMLFYGFEKNDNLNYSILSLDGTTKFVVRIPNGKNGFIIGAQFLDFGEYTGIISDCIMKYYEYEELLVFPNVREYSQIDIVNAVNTVIAAIKPYINKGKQQLKEHINNWVFGAFSDKERNDVLSYLGLPVIDPYSDEYMIQNIEKIARGGFVCISLKEYEDYKDYYNKYLNHGCYFSFDSKSNILMIRLLMNK